MQNFKITKVEEDCIKDEAIKAIVKFMIENKYLDKLNISDSYRYCTQEGFQLDFSILRVNIIPIEINLPIYKLNISWELPIVVLKRDERLEPYNPETPPEKGHLSDIEVELTYDPINGTPIVKVLSNISI